MRHVSRSLIPALASVLALPLLLACSGGTEPQPCTPGTANCVDRHGSSFQASVSGAVSRTLAGGAFYTSQGGFGIALVTDDQAATILLLFAAGGTPAAGTYDVGDLSEPDHQVGGGLTFTSGQQVTESYLASSGTVTITSLANNHVKGTFQITMLRMDGPNPGTTQVTVSGTFDSVALVD
jgi:hypothetical protein